MRHARLNGAHVQAVLRDIFDSLDEDGNGMLDHEEFHMILQSPDVLRLMSHSTNIKVQDLEDLWDWLDDDGSEEVSVKEFMQGFEWLNEPFRPKTLMRLQEKLTKDVRFLRERLVSLLGARFGSIMRQVASPIRKIHAVTEQVQVLTASFSSMRGILCDMQENRNIFLEEEHADAIDPMAPPGFVSLNHLERSMDEQLSEMIERIAAFEVAKKQSKAAVVKTGSAWNIGL